jgi:hypothetical protein
VLPYYLLMRRPLQKGKKVRKTRDDFENSLMVILY